VKKSIVLSVLICVCIALILQSCLLSKIDRTPYQQTDYYAALQAQLDTFSIEGSQQKGDTVKAGWAKANITPSAPVPMAGYGSRRGKKYTAIHDSIWARAIVFDNGIHKAAWVSLDLLIVPPEVKEALSIALPGIGYSIDQIYLTATHTHSSIGGWAKKLVGRLIAGKYDENVIKLITNGIIEAIRQAEAHKEIAKMGLGTYYAKELVNHRITPEGKVDSTVYVFKIQQASGATATIISFTAHATCLASQEYSLSRDYPGALVDSLEKFKSIDFAAFGAGGVGSHSPAAQGADYEKIANMATSLSHTIQAGFDSIPLTYQTQLSSAELVLPLRKPQWRISENWRLRPWLFYSLYGDYPATLTILKTGNLIWIGTPCDFSGELTLQIHKPARHPLIINSFNGGYIGYITEDSYYDRNHYETRVMNWFGPGNGAYFVETINQLVKKL
jgi:neutral ceramidase